VILVLSRFRVANGMTEDVQAAFRQRPRLVESAAGFLGIETCQDQTDPSVFYLLTRWSDLSSFRQWHSSDFHQRSNALIPKGLKLDPTQTQLVTLERLPDVDQWAELARDAAAAIGGFLSAGKRSTSSWLPATDEFEPATPRSRS
jgi:heme-degrading monooxygenase HmoA